jgi:hypothetical protein
LKGGEKNMVEAIVGYPDVNGDNDTTSAALNAALNEVPVDQSVDSVAAITAVLNAPIEVGGKDSPGDSGI